MRDVTPNAIRTVMIVDDSFFMRNLLRSILEMYGYDVIAEAENGLEAIDRYRDCRPDLVLMDVLMPGMNGVDATREILKIDRDACLVMCSILGYEKLVSAAREAGAAGVIVKPFNAEQVIDALRKALKGRPTEPADRDRKDKGAASLSPQP